MDVENEALNRTLQGQRSARKNRTPKIIARLKDMGVAISMDDLAAESGSPQIGRPHIGRLLVEKGFAGSIDEVFERYLGKDRPAYVDKPRVPAETAIDEIRKAGGLAVLAHPGLIRLDEAAGYEALVAELVSMGLSGIEVFYPKHSASDVHFFSAMAEKWGLLVTGGSDFHGDQDAGIRMGHGSGDLFVSYRLYEKLMEKLDKTPRTENPS
jgi:hypothetical protein